MELQFHDFENSAFVIFVALITRVFMQFRLNLYMPISAVDVNMKRAQKRDAVLNQKFYWRKHPMAMSKAEKGEEDAMVELTVAEIINGQTSKDGFVGLIPLIKRYLATKLTAPDVVEQLEVYLSFIADRASGKLQTGAKWQRDFVLNHPKYMKDSKVSKEIAYDLVKEIERIQLGSRDDLRNIYKN
jgi:glutamate--cysteine ligase catalytic subunit